MILCSSSKNQETYHILHAYLPDLRIFIVHPSKLITFPVLCNFKAFSTSSLAYIGSLSLKLFFSLLAWLYSNCSSPHSNCRYLESAVFNFFALDSSQSALLYHFLHVHLIHILSPSHPPHIDLKICIFSFKPFSQPYSYQSVFLQPLHYYVVISVPIFTQLTQLVYVSSFINKSQHLYPPFSSPTNTLIPISLHLTHTCQTLEHSFFENFPPFFYIRPLFILSRKILSPFFFPLPYYHILHLSTFSPSLM